jgi:hypothetical protein
MNIRLRSNLPLVYGKVLDFINSIYIGYLWENPTYRGHTFLSNRFLRELTIITALVEIISRSHSKLPRKLKENIYISITTHVFNEGEMQVSNAKVFGGWVLEVLIVFSPSDDIFLTFENHKSK